MSITGPTYFNQRSFVDFDQLAEDAKQWQLDLRQLDCGSFQGELLQFGIGNVHIAQARFGRSLLQNGAPPTGLRTIALPANPGVRFKWRGKQITGDDLVVFPRGAELESVSASNFHIYTCSFPDDVLAEASSNSGLGTLDELCGTSEVFRCNIGELNLVRQYLYRNCQALRTDERLLFDNSFVAGVTLELPTMVVNLIAESSSSRKFKTSLKRDLALKRAGAYIEQFAHEDLRIRDICQMAEVSQRTMQYAFVDRYGLTPKAFLLAFRLNAVRRELRSANQSDQRIVDIANRWGFWHMGQFAADYRKQFGELPSQTKTFHGPS